MAPGFLSRLGYAWASAYPWAGCHSTMARGFINGTDGLVAGGNYGGQWYASSFQTVPRITSPAGWTAATHRSHGSGERRPPTVLVGKPEPPALDSGSDSANFAAWCPGERRIGNAAQSSAI